MYFQEMMSKNQHTINRKNFFFYGCLLFFIKYNLDRFVAYFFYKAWFFTDYFKTFDRLNQENNTFQDYWFYVCLILLSIPFIWVGTNMCLKRINDANLPKWLVVFFFIPFINLLFFVILSIIPSKTLSLKKNLTPKWFPASKAGVALFAILLSIGICLVLSLIMVYAFGEYGWSLFVGMPFLLGFISVYFYGGKQTLSFYAGFKIMLLTVFLFNTILFLFALEGLICIAMAFPIMIVVGFMGSSIAYAIVSSRTSSNTLILAPSCVLLLLATFEKKNDQIPLLKVTTSVVVHHDKQHVWDQLVTFNEIKAPQEWIFKTGIAYPTHATISNTQGKITRHCHFTTGAFIEPITTWDEPNHLAFDVLDQPAPMIEWKLYQSLPIVHLDGYFQSQRGEFVLNALDSNTTALIGTTYYQHDLWPGLYWSMWSDLILHQVHLRVLDHIKSETEK